ncbi:MAG: hypothetical protein AB1546_03990 [bacterium]
MLFPMQFHGYELDKFQDEAIRAVEEKQLTCILIAVAILCIIS